MNQFFFAKGTISQRFKLLLFRNPRNLGMILKRYDLMLLIIRTK